MFIAFVASVQSGTCIVKKRDILFAQGSCLIGGVTVNTAQLTSIRPSQTKHSESSFFRVLASLGVEDDGQRQLTLLRFTSCRTESINRGVYKMR